MDGDDGAARVVFAGEQHGGFQAVEQFGVALHVALDIARDVFALARQLEERVQVVGEAADALVVGDGLFQALAVLHHLLAFFGLRPEIRRRRSALRCWLSFCFCAGASKIPPHGQGLVAERLVFAF